MIQRRFVYGLDEMSNCDHGFVIEYIQVEVSEEGLKKVNLLSELYSELEKKDYAVGNKADGVSLSFRFSCGKIDHTFPPTTSVKVRNTCKMLS